MPDAGPRLTVPQPEAVSPSTGSRQALSFQRSGALQESADLGIL